MASIRSSKFRFALVVSLFNREYTDALLASARAALKGHELKVVRVPGAYEIPLQVQRLARAFGQFWSGSITYTLQDFDLYDFALSLIHISCRQLIQS